MYTMAFKICKLWKYQKKERKWSISIQFHLVNTLMNFPRCITKTEITFSVRVGAHPVPSIECSRNKLEYMNTTSVKEHQNNQTNVESDTLRHEYITDIEKYLRQISPVSAMFGCHILVMHLTFGGCGKQNMVCNITALPWVHVWIWFCLTEIIVNKSICNRFYLFKIDIIQTENTDAAIMYSMWKTVCIWTLKHINLFFYTQYTK